MFNESGPRNAVKLKLGCCMYHLFLCTLRTRIMIISTLYSHHRAASPINNVRRLRLFSLRLIEVYVGAFLQNLKKDSLNDIKSYSRNDFKVYTTIIWFSENPIPNIKLLLTPLLISWFPWRPHLNWFLVHLCLVNCIRILYNISSQYKSWISRQISIYLLRTVQKCYTWNTSILVLSPTSESFRWE